jgi:hypothetical protein
MLSSCWQSRAVEGDSCKPGLRQRLSIRTVSTLNKALDEAVSVKLLGLRLALTLVAMAIEKLESEKAALHSEEKK